MFQAAIPVCQHDLCRWLSPAHHQRVQRRGGEPGPGVPAERGQRRLLARAAGARGPALESKARCGRHSRLGSSSHHRWKGPGKGDISSEQRPQQLGAPWPNAAWSDWACCCSPGDGQGGRSDCSGWLELPGGGTGHRGALHRLKGLLELAAEPTSPEDRLCLAGGEKHQYFISCLSRWTSWW